MDEIYNYQFTVRGLENEKQAQWIMIKLRQLGCLKRAEVDVPNKIIKLWSYKPMLATNLNQLLSAEVELMLHTEEKGSSPVVGKNVLELQIDGMHCRSCEILIERKFMKVGGISRVEVNSATGRARLECQKTPQLNMLNDLVKSDGYTVRQFSGKASLNSSHRSDLKRPGFWRLLGLFGMVLLLGTLLTRLGVLEPTVAIGSDIGFWSAFIIGLVAASSSCLAVSGGVMLSTIANFRERYGGASVLQRMYPVFLFVFGRLISYALLGGIIGLIGKALSPSPLITGLVTLLAALYMIVMGLDMLNLAPLWLRRILPRTPKNLSHRILAQENSKQGFAPFLLGAATFFLPCGFTQALQLYALTTGSFVLSALVLFAFALGTAPALIGLGFASSGFKGRAGRFIMQLMGAAVVVLGFWNVQNGLAVAGYEWLPTNLWGQVSAGGNEVVTKGKFQVIKMNVMAEGYQPAQFTVKKGKPVRWEINAVEAGGCNNSIQAPRLDIPVRLLRQGEINVIEFTPQQEGKFIFSCSMGMYRGVINVTL